MLGNVPLPATRLSQGRVGPVSTAGILWRFTNPGDALKDINEWSGMSGLP